jgi:aldehyde:ferredoxin oxidoreductase
MECSERGIELEGAPEWGDAEAVLRLLRDIADRRGLGALLADGVRAAAARIGQGCQSWAIEVKGLELPMHDPRGKKGMGLAYATAPHGAVHMQAGFDPAFEMSNPYPELGPFEPVDRLSLQGKAEQVKAVQDYWGMLGDTLGFCKFPASPFRPLTPSRVAEAVRLATGWDTDVQKLVQVGERIFNLCRLFNVREGIRRKDDTVPARLSEPLPEGRFRGASLSAQDLSTMLNEYYELRGWNADGVPLPETLARLCL